MRIKNEYNETVYWRAFKKDDTAYLLGLKQGSVNPGKIDTWRDDSFPEIKVEAKTGDIVFYKKWLASAGQLFKMSDDLVITSNGELTLAQVKLVISDQGSISEKRSDIQFVDLRNFNTEVERTITSRVSQTFSNTESFERATGHEQTWSVGGKIGGTLGKKDEAGGNAEVSAGYTDKVTDALKTSSQTVVTSVWEQSWSDKLRLSPGKIHVLEVVWTLTLSRGTATYLGERASYTVVRSATPNLLRPSAFDSLEKLPAEYRARWQQAQIAA